jgi:hypothetical protein
LALLEFWIEEVKNPDLFPTIKLENGTEVERLDVCVYKQVWYYLLRFLLLLSLLIEAAASKVELRPSSTSTKELTEDVVEVASPESLLELKATALLLLLSLALFVLADALCTLLVVDTSLVRVAEHIISISHFLKLLLGTFRIIRVFVRVELDRLLLECLFNVCLCCISLQTHNFVVVGRLVFFLLGLALLLLPLLALSS